MNRIKQVVENKDNILSIYFTAGFPALNDTVSIIERLESKGADLIEVGVPFSDPIADGPTIQKSNNKSLANGMTVEKLFEQLKDIRSSVSVPLIMMSSLNPIIQYGFEKFCQNCQSIGIDGLIIPDLPVEEYVDNYKSIVEDKGLLNIILITPASSDARIRSIDANTEGFIYMVSSSATTGMNKNFASDFEAFAQRLQVMQLKNPLITGFGIHNKASFDQVCQYSQGGIIGSAFVKALGNSEDVLNSVDEFMSQFK